MTAGRATVAILSASVHHRSIADRKMMVMHDGVMPCAV